MLVVVILIAKMSEPTKSPEEGIVVGGKKNRVGVDVGLWGRKLARLAVWLVIAAVVAGAGYFGWKYWSDHKSDNKPANSTHLKHYTLEQYQSNQVKAALKELADAKTDDQKAKAYTDLSNAYLNQQGGAGQSVMYARKLVNLKGTAEAYSQLAFALDQNGDYKGAADAYKQAAAKLSGTGAKDDGRSGYSYYLNAAKQEEAKL
jgi:predicted negative regulator of RcsB-dependent stress response